METKERESGTKALRDFLEGRSLIEKAMGIVALRSVCSDDPARNEMINEYCDKWEAEVSERAAHMCRGKTLDPADGAAEVQFAAMMLAAKNGEGEPKTPSDDKPEDVLIGAFMARASLTEKAVAIILNEAISNDNRYLDNLGQRLVREWQDELSKKALAIITNTDRDVEDADEAAAVVLAAGLLY